MQQASSSDDITAPGFVWVYRYTYWDEASQGQKTSTRYATADVIRCGLGAIINASAKRIPVSKLIDGAFAE